MNNPFEQIDLRLSNIESLLIDIKHGLIGKIDLKQKPIKELITIYPMSTRLRNFLHSVEKWNMMFMSEINEDELPLYRNVGKKTIEEFKNLKRKIYGNTNTVD